VERADQARSREILDVPDVGLGVTVILVLHLIQLIIEQQEFLVLSEPSLEERRDEIERIDANPSPLLCLCSTWWV
jgi:hypothetical protein